MAISVAGIGLLLPIQPVPGEVLYQVIDLGTYNGAFRSEARGITQDGQVWGENWHTEYPYFLWRNESNKVAISRPGQVGNGTMALYGMNDAGQFAGSFLYTTAKPAIAFWRSPSSPQFLLVTNFAPRGLNLADDVDVVGVTSVRVESPPGSGVFFTVNRPAIVRGNQLTLLSTLAGDNSPVNAEAMAINNARSVVGWSVTASNNTHAFLWDGTMHDLHAPGTLSNSIAVAINQNGVVVGYRYTFSSFREPFIWTPAEGMVALELPAGYSTGQPLGLNNRGDAVGVAGSGSAVLWTNGVMTDLQTVITNSPAWDLDGAYGINDRGEIVGYGKNGGLTKGFLLRPINLTPAQFTIELLDPADPAVTNVFTGSGITADLDTLNRLSARRSGIAADGASSLVVRLSSTNSGTLGLTLRADEGALGVTGNSGEDGSIGRVNGDYTSDGLGEHTTTTAQGPRAYLRYHAPKVFHRAGTNDSSRTQRLIRMQAIFTPDIGPAATQSVTLIIVRPPVVVMHGLWSKRDLAFGGFQQEFRQAQPGVLIFGPDYPNAVYLRSNAMEVPKAIASACVAVRDQDFACTRADIFGHSMGGILSRIWAGSTNYKRSENYHLGDINRLVTIDSPHRGGYLADLAGGVQDWLTAQGPVGVTTRISLEIQLAQKGMVIHQGAIHDLRSTSDEIRDLNRRPTEVAAHVIAGDYEVNVDLTQLPEPLGGFYTLLKRIPFLDYGTLYVPTPHSDLVVTLDSQGAGLLDTVPPAAPSTVYSHQHTGAANTSPVIARCLFLYRQPPDSVWYWRGFPTGWTAPPPPSPPLPPPAPSTNTVNHIILLLASGPDANSGKLASVSVSEPPGVSFSSVLILARDVSLEKTNPPFDFTFTVPPDAIGDYPVSYFAVDTASNTWWGTQKLYVTPFAGLYSLRWIEIEPSRYILTHLGEQRQLTATGIYFDQPRDITDPSTTTTYASADTSIVSVETNGVMTARGKGTTKITITNAGKTAFVDVVVDLLPSPDLALIQTVVPSNAFGGAPVVFTLRVTNVGPETANGVFLNAPLPVDAQFLSATTSQGLWSFTNGVITAELGTIAPAGSASLTITASFSTGGAHTNTASVAAVGLDANEADNEATAVVTITVLPSLNIRLQGQNLILSWSTNTDGYELEQTSDLTPTPAWNPAITNPPIVGDQFELSFPPTNGPAYFRLRHP